MPSIIAAIIKRGITIMRKTLRDWYKRDLNSFPFLEFFVNIVSPSFNPKPREINIAGSSKIPWGRMRHHEERPATL